MTDKTIKWLVIENIAIFMVTTAICWIAKSAWGLVTLIFINSWTYKKKDAEKKAE